MAIHPKCEHLKISMITCSLLGIFPGQFMFENNKFLQKAYVLYSNLLLSYYVFFLITAFMKLFAILNSEGMRMDALSGNMCITLINAATVGRQLIMKFNPRFTKIVKQVIDSDKHISSLDDKELVDIYNDCAQDTKQKTKLYLCIMTVHTMQYLVRPISVGPLEQQVGNQTVLIRPLLLSKWMPFDEQDNYMATYMWHLADGLIGVSYLAYTDIFMFNLITYAVGQIKMLRHVLSNFEIYKEKYQTRHNVADGSVAAYATFTECIEKHIEIIEYVKDFSDIMNLLMVFDFLQSSLQIATILTQALGNTITIILVFFVGWFFLGMVLRLILYYYYANEVMILSETLASAVWESNWYDQSPKVKYMMFIFMMRAQKPIKFLIGPFGVMSLDSFIAILKTTYSYIMLMYGIN